MSVSWQPRRVSLLGALMALALGWQSQGADAKRDAEPWRIVILSGSNFHLPASMVQDQALRRTLVADSSRPIEFYPEALETMQLPSAEYEAEYTAFLRKKYAPIKVNLVLTITAYALDFAEKYRDVLWPGAPVVFYSVAEELVRHRQLKPGFTGQAIAFDVKGTVDLAMRLQPDARRAVIVGGIADSDQYWVARFAEYLSQHERKPETRFLTNLPLAELTSELSRLTPDSIVLYGTMFRDVAGRLYVPVDIVAELSAACRAPIYSFQPTYLGEGIVGGSLTSFEDQGRLAARLALRVLGGEKPEDIPVQLPPASGIQVDGRQMRRWNLSESRLPEGAEVVFRENGLWRQYARFVILSGVALALQAWIIGGLLFQRRRRRHVESALRESQERFRSMADTAPVMIWTSGPDRRCDYFNRRWLDFTGRPLAEELGEGWTTNVHPEDVPYRVTAYSEAFDARAPFSVEYRLRRHDGQYRWILAQAVPRLQGDGEFLGYVGSCIDITDRKMVEEANRNLAHVSRVSTMGQLAAALAHELNQPLGAILRNAEAGELILQQSPIDHEELRAVLSDIRKDDHRAGAVIDRMRALLKKRNLVLEPVAIQPLVDQIVTLVRTELQARRIVLQLRVPTGLPLVSGDRVQLQQVLLNLLMNAADALDQVPHEQRRIEVDVRHVVTPFLEVAVRDTGRGVPEEKLAGIFEPFYTTKTHGMGMGLAISRIIIESQGGRIWAENAAGGGALFRFTVPLSRSKGPK